MDGRRRIADILKHPAFAGFAHLLLPWDDRRYDTTMPLRNVSSLLPYHSHVDPGVVVSSLNRMIDDATAGRAVFYDIYTDGQKQVESSRKNAGLFFFRGKPGAPFAVIAPGGEFAYVDSLHEGFPYAVEISNRGYIAFVLKYRAGHGGTVATEDLAAALSYIFRNASDLGVSTAGYSLWGSSAGARMAAAIGSHGTARYGRSNLPKPSAVVLLYTGHSDLASTEPPTFVAVGDRDGIAPPRRWKSGLPRCADRAPTWNIESTRVLVMASASASVRVLKDGSQTLFASGRNRFSNRLTPTDPSLRSEVKDEDVHGLCWPQ